MAAEGKVERRLLLIYCSFTCIYLTNILAIMKFSDKLHIVGKYTFLSVLWVLIFAEVVKLVFPMLQPEAPTIIKVEPRRAKKSWSNLREIFKFLLAALVLSVIYYVIIVLFGAPVLTDHEETTMLVLTLVTLTFIPTSLHLGVDSALDMLMGIYPQKGSILADALRLNIQLTILGTWLGAIVIPLDWDRYWQAWPIPCVIGALLGYLTAHFVTLLKMLPVFSTLGKSLSLPFLSK